MLKFKLDTLEGLDESLKALYVKSGDKFILGIEGLEDGDVAGLKNQVNALLAENKNVKKQLKDVTDAQASEAEKARKAAEDAARASGDVAKLDESWQRKHSDALAAKDAEYRPQIDSLTGDVNRLLIDNVAQSMASRIAIPGKDVVLIPHIKSRLRVDMRDGKRTTVVVDGNGQPSASSLEDLQKEFVGNEAFKPLIAGGQGSGSGAPGENRPGGGAAPTDVKRSAMTTAEKSKYISDHGKNAYLALPN